MSDAFEVGLALVAPRRLAGGLDVASRAFHALDRAAGAAWRNTPEAARLTRWETGHSPQRQGRSGHAAGRAVVLIEADGDPRAEGGRDGSDASRGQGGAARAGRMVADVRRAIAMLAGIVEPGGYAGGGGLISDELVPAGPRPDETPRVGEMQEVGRRHHGRTARRATSAEAGGARTMPDIGVVSDEGSAAPGRDRVSRATEGAELGGGLNGAGAGAGAPEPTHLAAIGVGPEGRRRSAAPLEVGSQDGESAGATQVRRADTLPGGALGGVQALEVAGVAPGRRVGPSGASEGLGYGSLGGGSVAPMARAASRPGQTSRPDMIGDGPAGHSGGSEARDEGRGVVLLDGRLVGEWLMERMARDATRPGAGTTFFDSRQAPAWSPSGTI